MGLFKKETCPICGNEVKGLVHAKIKDGILLCGDCTKKLDMEISMLQFQTLEDIRKHMEFREENYREIQQFQPTDEKPAGTGFFREDANMGKWYYTPTKKVENPTLYTYDQIVDYEFTEDGDVVQKGGLGGAVAGGLLFGGAGAVAGSVLGKKKQKTVINSMKIRVSLNHPYKNQIVIELLPLGGNCKSGSMTYNVYKSQANDIISFLDGLTSKASQSATQNAISKQQVSEADEILKYKQLLDQGIISQEEFDAKKKQLLGL